ncbi:hypothetical protein Q6280_27195, partial [Klebsiella pneumoniae]|nr:hypothetical protein [Klebsiella pneumoniae]
IVTNLVMLPVAASLMQVDQAYALRVEQLTVRRQRWLRLLAQVAVPRNAVVVLAIAAVVLGAAVWNSRDRVVGTLEAGAPELRPESRFNRDALA